MNNDPDTNKRERVQTSLDALSFVASSIFYFTGAAVVSIVTEYPGNSKSPAGVFGITRTARPL
jgi:hypothetical protein